MADYSNYDYGLIVANVKFVLDARNAIKGVEKRKRIVRLEI